MNHSKQKLISYTQDQRHYIQNIFDEFKECGPHFISFTKSANQNLLYASNSTKWEKIFIEENILEKDMFNYVEETKDIFNHIEETKDMFNYVEETTVLRKWICWDNLPQECDPYDLTRRRIEVCQTVKSASFIVPAYRSLHTFNFAFDHDLDIENFIWENNLLIENYVLGMAKMLSQSGS